MRPRRYAADDKEVELDVEAFHWHASMRPRRYAADDQGTGAGQPLGLLGFNEAAALCRG